MHSSNKIVSCSATCENSQELSEQQGQARNELCTQLKVKLAGPRLGRQDFVSFLYLSFSYSHLSIQVWKRCCNVQGRMLQIPCACYQLESGRGSEACHGDLQFDERSMYRIRGLDGSYVCRSMILCSWVSVVNKVLRLKTERRDHCNGKSLNLQVLKCCYNSSRSSLYQQKRNCP